MTPSTPLRKRPLDLVLAVFFVGAAASSFLADSVTALDIPIAKDSANPLAAALHWYAKDDPLLLSNPFWLRVQTWVSAFIFGPFYVVLVYALVRGRAWIRIPALIYVGAMTHGMLVFLGTEIFGPSRPTSWLKFCAFNLPYLVMPLLLGWRFRRPAA